MIAFDEGAHRRLPVAGEIEPLPPGVAHLVQLERIQHRRDWPEIVEQRLAIRIHVDPDPSAPAVALHRLQPDIVGIQRLAPILGRQDESIFAVQIPAPAMKAAIELIGMAAAGGQPAPAVLTYVVISLDPVLSGAHHDDGFVHDIVGDIIADLRDFLDPAGRLPHPGP